MPNGHDKPQGVPYLGPTLTAALERLADEAARDPNDPWSAFPIVYDRTIKDEKSGCSIRMEFDASGQVMITQRDGSNAVVFMTDAEQCTDLMHMIMRGLNRVRLEGKTGWAA